MSPATERIILGVVGLATGIAAQYATVSAPAMKTSEANRDANWSARAELIQCHDERDKILDRLLEIQ